MKIYNVGEKKTDPESDAGLFSFFRYVIENEDNTFHVKKIPAAFSNLHELQ